MKYEEGVITVNKILNNLDKFTISFVTVLEKHTPYVLVSGYVSILLGRSRISEDIDLLIPKLSKEKFLQLHEELLKKEFWCLNADDTNELYDMLMTKHSIRYGKHENPLPNMEVKFVHTPIDTLAFEQRILVKLPENTLSISPLDLQIAFKEEALGSDKDKEDAEHLRQIFKKHLLEEKINNYKQLIKNYGT